MYQSSQSQSVDGVQGGCPSKTPVSLLQELCMRRGISPKYDLLQIEGPVHEPTFVYRVTVGEFAANGSGQTKKKAKHAAAKAVLDIILQGGSGTQGLSGGATELATQIVSSYDDGIPGNPVGALQELCMSRRWPPPTYKLTAEEGFPHERTFSICCTIGSHKEIGAGKSKKLSKRQAAHKMIQKLKDQPADHPPMNVLADDDDEVNYYVSDESKACRDGESHSPAFSCGNNVPLPHYGMPLQRYPVLAPYTKVINPFKNPSSPASLMHTCSHFSPVREGFYRVCQTCFNSIDFDRVGTNCVNPLKNNCYSRNAQNGISNSVCNMKAKNKYGNDINVNVGKTLYESEIERDEVYHTNYDLGQLEIMFDKFIKSSNNDNSENCPGSADIPSIDANNCIVETTEVAHNGHNTRTGAGSEEKEVEETETALDFKNEKNDSPKRLPYFTNLYIDHSAIEEHTISNSDGTLINSE